MNDIAQTIKRLATSELLLSLADGSCHTKTETTAIIYLYLQHFNPSK